jgi:hypothetical protein
LRQSFRWLLEASACLRGSAVLSFGHVTVLPDLSGVIAEAAA